LAVALQPRRADLWRWLQSRQHRPRRACFRLDDRVRGGAHAQRWLRAGRATTRLLRELPGAALPDRLARAARAVGECVRRRALAPNAVTHGGRRRSVRRPYQHALVRHPAAIRPQVFRQPEPCTDGRGWRVHAVDSLAGSRGYSAAAGGLLDRQRFAHADVSRAALCARDGALGYSVSDTAGRSVLQTLSPIARAESVRRSAASGRRVLAGEGLVVWR